MRRSLFFVFSVVAGFFLIGSYPKSGIARIMLYNSRRIL